MYVEWYPYLVHSEGQVAKGETGKGQSARGPGQSVDTTMEGSFRTQKEHYAMRQIKAKMKMTEILYIFFGIRTANTVLLVD